MGCTSGLKCLFGVLVLVSVTVGQTLKWLQRPQDVSARVGENVTFVCRLNVPTAEIAWEKDATGLLTVNDAVWVDNTRLSVINKYDLVITDVQKEDDGEYSCKSKDVGVQTARLTVLLHPGVPELTVSDQTLPYKEGDQLTLTCSSTGGNPSPRITWLKNGNLSTVQASESPADTVGGLASSSITLTLDKSDHQANFSCLVYNELNVNSKLTAFTVLNVQYAPVIGFRPYSPVYHVRKGDDVTVVCDVDANPPVNRVTWDRDGLSLPGINPTLTLTDIQEDDAGIYDCTAENSIGRKKGTLEIDVQYPPILSTPPTMTVNEGEDINVECNIQANPSPYEIQWSKISSNGASRTVTNSATLTLSSVVREIAGNYSCTARSQMKISGESLRVVTSLTFTYIYVQYKPGKASIGPVPDVDIGERLDLTCTATPAGYPEAVYVWAKDDIPLPVNGQTYTKRQVSLDDNGRYSCTPSNSRGSGDKSSVNVNVYEPPTIIQRPEIEVNVMLTYDSLLSLTCTAQGYPEPQVTWYQEGDTQALNLKRDLFTVLRTTSLEGKYRVRVESVLQFLGDVRDLSSTGENSMLKIRDMGNYTCQAESNKHSDAPTAVSKLMINFPPVVVETPTRYAKTRLDRVELLCECQGNPVPTFQWFYKGASVVTGQQGISIRYISDSKAGRASSRLSIDSVSDKTYGVYLCAATNTLGNSSREITLSPKSRPEQAENLKIVSTSWESVLLSWQPGFNGGYEQRFYINQSGTGTTSRQIDVMPLSASSFNVSKLRPNTNYTFRVMAANQLGPSLYSSPVTATTNDLLIPALPDVPVYNVKQKKLLVVSPGGNQYCLRVEVRARKTWKPLDGCMKVMGDTLEIVQSDVTAVNVSVCLSHRTDVCGQPATAEIHSAEKDPVLTEDHVIIIACVCAVIIITLLIILFCFICRRRRNAAKANQGGNAGDPPPYQSVPPIKKPQQVYDNQGMDMSDLALTQTSHAPSAPPLESDRSNNINNHHNNNQPPSYLGIDHNNTTHPVHANHSYTNTSYGPLEFYGDDGNHKTSERNTSGGGVTPSPKSAMRQLTPRSLYIVDYHQYDNDLNDRLDNNRMDNYPNRDNMSPTTGVVPHSPTKDKYIDLQDRGGGMDATDQGYAPNAEQGGGKPKKVIYEVVV